MSCSLPWLLKVDEAVNQSLHGLEMLFQGFAAQILSIAFSSLAHLQPQVLSLCAKLK